MKRLCALLLPCLLAVPASAGAATITYSYTGNPMNYLGGLFDDIPDGMAYATTMFVTGTFTVDESMLGGAVLTDITASVTALSFNDGRQTLTLATATDSTIMIAVDGLNQITQWFVSIREPLPAVAGLTSSMIQTWNDAGFATDVGQIRLCVTVLPCNGPVDQAQSLLDPGVWTMSPAGEDPALVPEPATVLLAGSGLALSLHARRRRGNRGRRA